MLAAGARHAGVVGTAEGDRDRRRGRAEGLRQTADEAIEQIREFLAKRLRIGRDRGHHALQRDVFDKAALSS